MNAANAKEQRSGGGGGGATHGEGDWRKTDGRVRWFVREGVW